MVKIKMDFSKLKDKLAKAGLQNTFDFLRKNIRYFAAGALFVVLVAVLVSCMEPKKDNGESVPGTEISTEIVAETETEEGYQVDAVEAVNELIAKYYKAYAAGDIDTVSAIATPMSQNEKSYISMMSQYVEEYQNIKCYTKPGLEDGSYLTWVYMEVKFDGIDTAAPGMELFYVRTAEDGSLYIDNLYSNYNKSTKESGIDAEVQAKIDECNASEEIAALQQEVQAKYEAVVASDEALAGMVNETIPGAVTEWMTAAVQEPTEDTEEPTEEATEEPTEEPAEDTETADENKDDNNGDDKKDDDKKDDDKKDDNKDSEEEPSTETLYATARINVRAAADTSSDKLGNIEMGEAVVRTGTDGDWSIIEYKGSTGYVKSEYLTSNAGGAANDETADGLAEGTKITLQSTVNVRASMGEDAEKIGTAYAGEKVTVIMSYAEGWTKVTWNDKTGYIKTSLLQ